MRNSGAFCPNCAPSMVMFVFRDYGVGRSDIDDSKRSTFLFHRETVDPPRAAARCAVGATAMLIRYIFITESYHKGNDPAEADGRRRQSTIRMGSSDIASELTLIFSCDPTGT
jgi:hypothetical protein